MKPIIPSDSELWIQTELAAEMYTDDLVDGKGQPLYLDSIVSMSGMVEVEVDAEYDPTHIELNK